MGKFNYTQTTFAGGKLSPLMKGRVDLKEYYQGCEILSNFESIPIGGVHRRKWFQHYNDTSVSSADVYAHYPYNSVVSINTATIGIRVFKPTPTSMTFHSRYLTNNTGLGVAVTFTVDSTVTIDLKYVQVGRLMIFTHHTGKMRPIIYDPENNVAKWYEWGKDFISYPYLTPNTSATTLTPSATTGSITITASTSIFASTMIGSILRITHGSTEGMVLITGYTSGTVLSGTVLVTFGAITASTNWRVSAWVDSYPIDVTFYEGRLVFLHEDGIQASYRGNLFHLNQTPLIQDTTTDVSGKNFFGLISDNNQFPFTLQEGSIDSGTNAWIAGGDMLYVATTNTVTAYTGGDTAISLAAKREFHISASSCKDVRCTSFNDGLVFVSTDKKTLNMLKKSSEGIQLIDLLAANKEELDGYQIFNTTFLNKSKQLYVTFRDEVTVSDEKIVCISLNSDDSMYSLKNIVIASPALGIQPKSVFSLTAGIQEDLWVVAQSDILKPDQYYFLSYSPFINNKEDGDTPIIDFRETMTSVTSIFSVVNAPANQYYLDGTVITAYDPALKKTYEVTIASGAIDLSGVDNPPTTIIVGFPFESKLKTMPIEAGAEEGSAQGEIKRIDRCDVLVYKSKGFKIGSSDTRYETDRSSSFFTGRKKVYFPSDPDVDQQVQIVADGIYHCTILNITSKGQTNI